MRVIGLTGGVGSGKSFVAQMMEEECLAQGSRAELLLADEIGHLVMEPGRECHMQITDRYGREILGRDGRIDRGMLAEKIFGDEQERQALNAIVHPAVIRYMEEYIGCRREQEGIIVLESAILFEASCDRLCDIVWYVRVPEQIRRARLRESRGYSEEKISAIMQRQLSEEEFIRRSDDVIDNSTSPEQLRDTVRQMISGIAS